MFVYGVPGTKREGMLLRFVCQDSTVQSTIEALLFFWFFFVGMTPQSTTALLLLLLFVWVGGWVGGWVFWSRVPGIVHDLNRCAPS